MTALLLAVCLLAEPRATTAETAHYRVRAEGLDAAELGAMLEQLHAELSRYFGKAPDGPLDVEVYASAEQFKAALARDGEKYLGGGGYYAPRSRRAYLHVQPSRYYTRQLILHEATHQFHFLVATGNRLLPADWYVEGLAEYYGMHNWDGQTLRTGAVPAISLEDYPARALEEFQRHADRFEDVIAGVQPVHRSLAWALVHYLRDRDDRRFRRLGTVLDRGTDPRAAWQQEYGRVTPALVDGLREWIEAHQQPWQSVWIEWQQRGGALEGFASTTGLAILKQTPQRLAVRLRPVSGPLRAGVVFGYRDPQNFHLLHVFDDGRVWIIAREEDQWRTTAWHRIPGRPGAQEIALERRDGQAILAVNGHHLPAVETDGQVGLTVDGCEVRFEVNVDETP